MESLRLYLNKLEPEAQSAFAQRCKTSVGYLRKAISKGQKLSTTTVIDIERESGGAVACEDLRPDIDWKYLRTRRLRSYHPVLAR